MTSSSIDINWFIIDVFRKKQFFDASTFIMRVIYCLQQSHLIWMDVNNCVIWEFLDRDRIDFDRTSGSINIMTWCKIVYDIHFKHSTIPHLYARIQSFVILHRSGECKKLQDIHEVPLKYTKMYITQRNKKKLSYLSKLYDKWVSTNNGFASCDELHFGYLAKLFSINHMLSLCFKHECQNDFDAYCKYFVQAIDFLMIHQNKFHRIHYEQSWCRASSLIPHLLDIFIIKFQVEINDALILKRIGKLCRWYNESIISDREMFKIISYHLLGYYHFWYRGNRYKAMKYMYKGYEIIKNDEIKGVGVINQYMQYLNNLHNMEYTMNNTAKCMSLCKYALKIYPTENDIGAAEGRRHLILLLKRQNLKHEMLDKYKDISIKEGLIQIQNKMMKQQYKDIIHVVFKKYIHHEKYWNVMKHLVKLKQCNYIKCNGKDMRSFKVCQRCKSVYYCCRKHQKMDWNKDHRAYCIQREERVYYQRRFLRNVNESDRSIATRLFS